MTQPLRLANQGAARMSGFDTGYFDRITQTVEDIETQTSAEVVVAIHPQSGRYRDADYLCGSIFAIAWLLFAVFNPWFVHPAAMLPFEAAALFGIGAISSINMPQLRLWLTTRERRDGQVRTAAGFLFVEDGVANTRERTGVLIYLSRLEQQIEVIADIGILDRIDAAEWNACVFELHKAATADDAAEALVAGLNHVGAVLASELPASEDNPDEIPNRPRVSQ